MIAAYVDSLGGPDRIRVGELPVPAPGPGEVLVRTSALAVNHVDTFVRSGAYRTPVPFPFVIGRDLVGVVESPSGIRGFAPGQRVWCNSLGHAGRQGSFAQYAAVPADRLYPLPDGVDPVAAVSVLHTGGTAWLGLFAHARLARGGTAVIGGAGGGVGSAAVQLAAAAGARVIATSRPSDFERVRGCGAGQVLDFAGPDLYGRLRAVAGPGGVDVYWDTSGHHDLPATLPLLARGGRVLITAGLRAEAALPVGALYTADASLRGFAISNASVAELAAAAEAINAALVSGALRGRVALRLPLAEAARAHELVESGEHPPGRIVVLPPT